MLHICCALAGLIILPLAYCPLMSKLDTAAAELSAVQTELLNQQGAIAALENLNSKANTISQNDLFLAIGELTEKGRSLGLQFRSIAQQPLRETTQAGIARLPINLTIDSQYKSIGLFLVYIEDSFRAIRAVERVSIHPVEDTPSALRVELVLCLYVEI